MFELLENATSVLLGTTATVAIVHALLGIDHSLPFIVLGRSRRWSLRRTISMTLVCGVGHVASSVLIAGVGAVAGVTFDSIMWLEFARGEVAASLLIGFGLAYAAWAAWRMLQGTTHSHVHAYPGAHLHPHITGTALTPWALFVIFILGPCEPLIPLMVVPAISRSWVVLTAVVGVFGVFTVATMAVTVAVGYRSVEALSGCGLTRFADAGAGLVVAASGAALLLLVL